MPIRPSSTASEVGRADDHIDKLAKRFRNVDEYPFRQAGEKRVIVRSGVDRVGGLGRRMQPRA